MRVGTDESAPSSTAPLAIWLLVQLAATALVALRVPLAAAYPHDAERLAAHWVLGMQVVAGGMLFPFLFRDVRTTIQVIATSAPFQFAAAALAALPVRELLGPILLVLCWLIGLAAWAAVLTSARAQLLAVAGANCLTLGGGLVQYLRLDFGQAGSGDGGL